MNEQTDSAPAPPPSPTSVSRCAPEVQATCCEAQQKADCCGAKTDSGRSGSQ